MSNIELCKDDYLTENVVHDIAKMASKVGLLDDKKYQVFKIKELFKKKRKEGLTIEKAEVEIGKEYGLEPGTIHDYIYKKHK
jgi:hypothetical protein